MSVRLASEESLNYGKRAIPDIPQAPTIGTATDSFNGGALVTFTPAVLGGAASVYTVTSSPGGFTGAGGASPVEVDGLVPGTSYTFTVIASNSTGTSAASAATSSYVATAAQSYWSIATVTVGATAVNPVSFTNIPQGYSHLQLRFTGRTNYAGTNSTMYMCFNGDVTSGHYASHYLQGDGASVYSGNYVSTQNNITLPSSLTGATATASIFGGGVIDVLDYTNTTKLKTSRAIYGKDVNGSGGMASFSSGVAYGLSVTSPITQIDIYFDGAAVQYSRFALYGVK